MNTEIELHDSELLHVDMEAGKLLIDAYVHRSGIDIRREGGYQHALFRFEDLQIKGELGKLPGGIYDWTIFCEGLNQNDLIPIPFKVASPVKIQITFGDDGREVIFLGEGLTVEEEGPYRFVEFWRD